MKKMLLLATLAVSMLTPPPVFAKETMTKSQTRTACSLCNVSDFDNRLTNNTLVIVDFYSPSCPPCMRLKPVFEKVAQEMTNLLFITVNVQQFSSLASRYGVSSIPHLKIFKNGQPIATSIGYKSEGALKSWINSVIS